MPTHSKTLQPH